MLYMVNENHFDDISLSFLEGVGDNLPTKGKPRKKTDESVLNKALDYNVNLDDMENLSSANGLKMGIMPAGNTRNNVKLVSGADLGNYSDEYDEVAPRKSPFENIDVHLQDIIDKCFHNSERPIVIISDDKIIYSNASFLKLVNIDSVSKILDHNFLEYVLKDYWNIVAESIGEALTTSKSIQVGLKDSLGNLHKVNFDAVYIPDNHSFSFILIGEYPETTQSSSQSLYDPVTGLPSYYLLEDRIRMIVSRKNSNSVSFGKNITALVGIGVDNISYFVRLGNANLILKRLTSRLGLSLNKNYMLARGLKFEFLILIPDIDDYESLNTEVKKIKEMFEEPVEDNFSRYDIQVSIGVSTFPEPATSGKKLMEQTVMSVEKAQKEGNGKIVIFGA